MIQETKKYICDYCDTEMNKFEYELAPSLSVSISLPHPEGKCGESSSTRMIICDKCSKELGIVNSMEYHTSVYSQQKLGKRVIELKKNIVDFCFKKTKEKLNAKS